MDSFIDPPRRIPLLPRLGIRIAEGRLRKRLLAARILSWYPKAAIGSGVMEALVAHESGDATSRLLKLVRMQVSFSASCPFCIDLNSAEYAGERITQTEIEALQGLRTAESVSSFSDPERTALVYARALTATPIRLESALIARLKDQFTEREIVVLASTIGQVNFWTRTIQGLGVRPEGFTESCEILRLEEYSTLDRPDGGPTKAAPPQ